MDFIEPCFGIGHNLSLICQMTSEDIKHQLIIKTQIHLTYVDFIEPCFGIGHNLSLICQMTSEDIKHQLIIIKTQSTLSQSGEGTHTHPNSHPYQLHTSTQAFTGQAFSTNKKSTTHQIQPKQTKYLHTNISIQTSTIT